MKNLVPSILLLVAGIFLNAGCEKKSETTEVSSSPKHVIALIACCSKRNNGPIVPPCGLTLWTPSARAISSPPHWYWGCSKKWNLMKSIRSPMKSRGMFVPAPGYAAVATVHLQPVCQPRNKATKPGGINRCDPQLNNEIGNHHEAD